MLQNWSLDNITRKLNMIKKNTESVKRRAVVCSNLIKIADNDTTQALGALQKVSSPGKKLQKLGFIMLFIPEPTGATCAVGGPLILAGKFLEKKFNSSTISDVRAETINTFNEMKSNRIKIL